MGVDSKISITGFQAGDLKKMGEKITATFPQTDPEKGGEGVEGGVGPKKPAPPASPPIPPFFRAF